MKTKFTTIAFLLSVFAFTQFFQPSNNLSHLTSNFRNDGRVVLGEEYSNNYKFQVFKNSIINLSSAFGNQLGRLEINAVGSNNSFAPGSIPGDIVLKRLGNSHNLIFLMGQTIPDDLPYNAPNNFKFRFGSGTERNSLLIYNTGKITMGTEKYDDSGYRLFVKDGIKTEKVKVEVAGSNDWADYVFKEEYELLPLKDVESFIDKNGHLPNFPSAGQIVEEGGFELKQMNVKLLEKIEELTLYIIEQEKRIEALEAKIFVE